MLVQRSAQIAVGAAMLGLVAIMPIAALLPRQISGGEMRVVVVALAAIVALTSAASP
jgi:hypothetical protein